MTSYTHTLLSLVGIMCLPVSVLLLYAVYQPVFRQRPWHRFGLWLFALGYALLGLGILGEWLGLDDRLWIYLLADTVLVIAPCVMLLHYALLRGTFRHWWRVLHRRTSS
ncbi:MAG: hypothetical protein V3U76_00070 [Granulosicoccus sp.]